MRDDHNVVDYVLKIHFCWMSLQELTLAIGEALCALIDEGADREGRPKRYDSVSSSLVLYQDAVFYVLTEQA